MTLFHDQRHQSSFTLLKLYYFVDLFTCFFVKKTCVQKVIIRRPVQNLHNIQAISLMNGL